MRRFVLDTNIYIEAARDREKAEELANFSSAFLPHLYLHAVVIQELMAGAVSDAWRREVERGLVRPFEKRGRVVVPGYRAWKRSGEIVAELVESGQLSPGGARPPFMNDALLGASCRQTGHTLITRNTRDFDRIRQVEPLRFEEPWPR